VLEAQFPEIVETQPELIAHHYTEAGLGSEAVPHWHRAGQRSLQRWANVEAINHLKKGLELLGSPPDSSERNRHEDETRRYSLLIKLGEAQIAAGEFSECCDAYLRASEVARSLGAEGDLVNAALEYARASHYGGMTTPNVVRLLEEALRGLGSDDNPLTAKVLGSLALALGVMGEQQQAMVYAEKAVAMAHRYDDPGLLAISLKGMFYALSRPEQAHQRLIVANQLLEAITAAKTAEVLHEELWARSYALFEAGDVVAADQDSDDLSRWGEERNRPFTIYLVAVFRAARAAMSGRFEESERLAQQALAVGQRVQGEAASGIFGQQMFVLRRQQGRLKEVAPVVRMFVQQNSAAAAWRPGLAVIYSELGLTDDARTEFEGLAQHDFADLPPDVAWLGTMTYLVDVCTFLADRPRAEMLYQILIPFDGANVVVGSGIACHGALSRYLGALATVLERWDDAERHFEDALAMNARMDARPFLAHTQQQYASMLLTRDGSGDRDKSATLLEAALATARELGMRVLEERVAAAITRMKAELN
jgi:tetratricopeptide (TPR) repeat protein